MARSPRILIVDDERRQRAVLQDVLEGQGYECLQAADGVEALEAIRKAEPDVLLVDIRMPRMDGLQLTRRIKQDEAWKRIPIVIVTGLDDVQARVQAFNIGADDFLTTPLHLEELRARVRSLVKVKAYNDHLLHHQEALRAREARAIEEAKEAHLDTIYRLSRAAEYRDEDTAAHIQRIGRYAQAVARCLSLEAATIETIGYAAPMHDVGKIGIPDKILLKPGKLDRDEWEIMKQHTLFGARILEGSPSGILRLGREIALTHHERWDGAGYPRGLRGEEIPAAGRVTALVDVFDALNSKRPYKEPLPLVQCFRIVLAGRGSQFDPQVVDAFFAARREILQIRDEIPDGAASILLRLSSPPQAGG
jgi:putative two-component system response regulator